MLVEEIDDESAEPDNTNGQLGDEIVKLEEPYQELRQDDLKVGIMSNKDVNNMEPAALMKNLDMEVTGMAQEPEGLGDENHNMKLAVQNQHVTSEMKNLEYHEEMVSMSSSSCSTTTRGEYRDPDDYNKSLMETYSQEHHLCKHREVRLRSSSAEQKY